MTLFSNACDSSSPVDAFDKQDAAQQTLSQMSRTFDDDVSLVDLSRFQTGLISPPLLSDQLKDLLEEHGIEPEKLKYKGLRGSGKAVNF